MRLYVTMVNIKLIFGKFLLFPIFNYNIMYYMRINVSIINKKYSNNV